MMHDALLLFQAILQACISWTATLFETLDATEYVLAFIGIALIVSCFVIPLRGSRLASIGDFGKNKMYNPRNSKNANKNRSSNDD